MTNAPLNSLVARLESAEVLDGPARTVARTVAGVIGNGAAKDLLRGAWLGHAAHPLLTDLPIGTWTSSVLARKRGARGRGKLRSLAGSSLLARAAGWAGI